MWPGVTLDCRGGVEDFRPARPLVIQRCGFLRPPWVEASLQISTGQKLYVPSVTKNAAVGGNERRARPFARRWNADRYEAWLQARARVGWKSRKLLAPRGSSVRVQIHYNNFGKTFDRLFGAGPFTLRSSRRASRVY